ncbi:MAG: type II toxin-antitoxin system PemK/MazF family toxin [Phyllobacteriaceae bacterium]|nr:type II toxin-antitoxin system PemK/MazF family toxin [Phyllobacteriaceae bacterium]
MPGFERGTIVRVPFPYTNRPVQQHRPAVVVSARSFNDQSHLLWVVMITSAENRPWPGDISLGQNYADFGLPAPSVIRPAKIATIEAAQASAIGILPAELLRSLDRALLATLGA